MMDYSYRNNVPNQKLRSIIVNFLQMWLTTLNKPIIIIIIIAFI